MMRILSIDPSGTGTTGLCFINGSQKQFSCFQNKEWKQHLIFLLAKIKQWQPHAIIYEHTNFINLRGKDMTSLLKLFGAIESLLPLGLVKHCASVPVNQVKALKEQILHGNKQIPGLKYQSGRGKGWTYGGTRISPHELDAYLVHYLGGPHD